jgi:superfamily I DNA/RNA helicase
MAPSEHRVILGPAGSGKTQVLIHRAAHLAEAYKVPPSRYRIFVFTNVIKEYIKSGLQFLNLPDETVCTFDHWCRLLYEENISRTLPRLSPRRRFDYGSFRLFDGSRPGRAPKEKDWSGIDFKKIRYSVLQLLQCNRKIQRSLDFVLVDEGQDLTPDVYEVLSLASRHITVFADPQQKIFEEGADESFILKKLNLSRRNMTLLGAYRNAPYVALLASHFISDKVLREQYLAQIHTEQKVRERPLCFVAPSFEKEMDRLAKIVLQRQVMNERIGIIVPLNRLLHGLAKGLAQRGVSVEKAIRQDSIKAVEVPCDFGNSVPKIATFHMAKGLTFDSVLLPRLVEASFPLVRGIARLCILFVGTARATQWVYLSTVKGREFTEIDLLREAAAEGHLSLQYQDEFEAPRESKEKEKPEDEFSVL